MSFSFFHHSARRILCPKPILSRYIQQAARDDRIHIPLAADQDSFEAAGLSPAVAASLRVAFPNVENPTAMQRKLLRAIFQNRDVLLQDDTGTGKSFAVTLALLSKLPAQKGSPTGYPDGNALAGLLIVPHRDLAYQYLHWIHHLTLSEGDTSASLTKYTQVLVRHANKSALRGLPIRMQEAIKSSSDPDLLIQKPPHILIATPNALLETIERRPEVCRVLTPSAIFVDEVDALLHIPGGKPPRGRAQEKLGKHVPDLVRILDRLYPASGKKDHTHRHAYSAKGPSLELGQDTQASKPQLVMVSATLRNKLRSALFNTFGWIRHKEVIKLIRKRSSALPAHRLGRSAVHHVLVVSKTGDIKNIAGARPDMTINNASSLEKNAEEHKDGEEAFFYDEDDDSELVGDADKALAHAPLAFDPVVLEAVAATFALDVPRIALLVLPATAAVRKIIFELQQLGVNAHPLDLVANEVSRAHVVSRMDEVSEENPALIVATLATIRGIDLPDLSHVFLLGVPGGRSGDAYLHVAGRVGRFGRRGKVVTILEAREEGSNEPRKMGILFSRIGIEPTLLEHFE